MKTKLRIKYKKESAPKFKLITFHLNKKYEFETETLDEAISLATDAFNNNHELHEIMENDKCLLLWCDVYNAINKVIY